MSKDKKIIAVVQARMNSTRLPGKVLLDLEGKPVIAQIIGRLKNSKKVDEIIVAVTDHKNDEAIAKAVHQLYPDMKVFHGSENDLIDRIYQATKNHQPFGVVKITSDSPLMDWKVMDKVIDKFLASGADYVSNALTAKHYPVGLDVEVYSFKTLEKLHRERSDEKEREFPALFIRENPKLFKIENVVNEKDLSFHRWTLDEPADYELVKTIYARLKNKPNFLMEDVLGLFEEDPNLITINQHVEQRWKNY